MPLLILDKLLLSILPSDLSARAGWLRRDKRLCAQAGQKVAYSGRAKSRVLRQGKRQCAQAGQKAVCSLPPKGAGDMKAIFILVPPGDYYVTGFHNQFPDDLF
jgi:hypothetical protein